MGGVKDKGPPLPMPLKLLLINCSSLVSESVTFPIDSVKTRMQVSTVHVGSFSTIKSVLADEGIGGFYKGLPPAILRHWVYTAARISLYEDFRSRFAGEGGDVNFLKKFAMGAASGGIGQFIASPADILKVQLITDRKMNNPPKYKGMVDCFRQLHRSGGILGFWRGVWPNVNRAMAVNLGELATYDLSKKNILQLTGLPDDVRVHTLSAISSGFAASLCSCPFDVVKTRMMAGGYTSSLQCFSQTIKQEGFLALYKGFFPCWARLGPWQFLFWVSYEHLRGVAGYGGF